MFERFTDRAHEVVTRAQAEAIQGDYEKVGSEHLLLALMTVEGSVSRETLVNRGFNEGALRALVGRGRGRGLLRHSASFTPDATKVIELSIREALQLGHNHVDDYHILLAILRRNDSTAVSMLVTRAMDGLRHAILTTAQAASQSPPEDATVEPDATPASSKSTLVMQLISRLEGKSEAELKAMLDSLS